MHSVIASRQLGVEEGPHRNDAAVGMGLGAAFLCLYLCTQRQTFAIGDPADLYLAPAPRGVPHPIGNSFCWLLARTALALIPVGEPAFRIGCGVAAAAAMAVVALYLVAREIGGSPWASATAAAVFGVSGGFRSQGTGGEVSSLHVLLITLLLLGALRYQRAGRRRDLAAMALVGSLGLTDVPALVLAGPAVGLLCGRRLWNDPGQGQRAAVLAVALSIGLALSLWLSVWDHPFTLPLLWNQTTACLGRVVLAAPDGHALPRRLASLGAVFQSCFPYVTRVLPILGAVCLGTQRRTVWAALLLAGLMGAGCALCGPSGAMAGRCLSLSVIAAAFMAIGLDRLRALICGPRPGTAFAIVLSLALIGPPLRRNWSRGTGPSAGLLALRSGYSEARDLTSAAHGPFSPLDPDRRTRPGGV